MPTLNSAPCHQKEDDDYDALKYCLDEDICFLSSKDTSAKSHTPRVSDYKNAFSNIIMSKSSTTSDHSGDKCRSHTSEQFNANLLKVI